MHAGFAGERKSKETREMGVDTRKAEAKSTEGIDARRGIAQMRSRIHDSSYASFIILSSSL